MAVLSRASAAGTTGKVVFHTPSGVGRVWLRNGRLVDAELGPLTGERALLSVLAYATSRWLEEPGEEIARQRLHVSLPELVRKAEARQRQWEELLLRLPPLSTVFQVVDKTARFDGARGKVFTAIDGRRPLYAVLDECGLDPVAVLGSIAQLLDSGAIRHPGPPSVRPDPGISTEEANIDGLFDALHADVPRAPAHEAVSEDPARPAEQKSQRRVETSGTEVRPSQAIVPFRRPSVDRYEVLERIGRGATATVYLCRRQGEGGFSRRFALKVLRPHLSRNPDAVSSLLREARLTGRLHHPNVVSVVDVGSHRGQPYLVMDYVPGCSVAELLEAEARGAVTIDAAVAAAIGVEALAGLHAAHTLGDERGRLLGLVHQDVSPENLLVGLDGVTRVTDFGVAHVSDALEPGGPNRGKPQYLAPERITGEKVDHRADVFALGAILFRLLTGLDLFEGDSTEEVMHQVLSKPIPPPSEVGRCPPPAFDAVCLKALERAPARRYQSAEHFRAELLRAAVLVDQMAMASEVADVARRAVELLRPVKAPPHPAEDREQDEGAQAALPDRHAIVLAPRPARRETQVLPRSRRPLPSWAVAVFLVLCLLLALLLDALSDSGPEPPSLERAPRRETPRPKLPEIRLELEQEDPSLLGPEEESEDADDY